MKISFAVTVHNEGEYVRTLLAQLTSYIEGNRLDYEIVVLDDISDDPATLPILLEFAEHKCVTVYKRKFMGDFADHKNYLNGLCKGDYIFQIDADERLVPELLDVLPAIIETNSDVDLFFVPRINTVEGLTPTHVKAWGWQLNERGWVQWPDYQTRIYRNDPKRIAWVGKVHERIHGFDKFAYLPADELFCIIHHKTITRQEKQNELYSTIH